VDRGLRRLAVRGSPNIFGRFLRHGNAYPDRLIRYSIGAAAAGLATRSTRTPGDGRVDRLRGHLEHSPIGA